MLSKFFSPPNKNLMIELMFSHILSSTKHSKKILDEILDFYTLLLDRNKFFVTKVSEYFNSSHIMHVRN